MFGSFGGREARQEEAMGRLRRLLSDGVPDSALKSFREERGLSQHGLARASGVVQGSISKIESGAAPLTAEAASRLAPALGLDPASLEAAHAVGELRQLALKSEADELDVEQLVSSVLFLDERLPDDEPADELLGTLVELAEAGLGRYKERPGVALKSAGRGRGPRDAHGRAIEKRFGSSKKGEEIEGPRRDSQGKRRKKPYAPQGRPVHGRAEGR